MVDRASLREEFEPELVTLETLRRDAVFTDSVVTKGLYPADASSRVSDEALFYEFAENVDSQLLIDLSLFAISGRGLRGFYVNKDPEPAYPTVAVLLRRRNVCNCSQTAVRLLIRRGWTLHELVKEVHV